MSSAKITLVGLYSFLMYDNVDLFSELKLPEGIDKDTVVANILQKSSEFEVQYPDTDYMINSIKFWSTKWYWTFDKWFKAINTKYDPLYNYDRTEQWTDDNVHADSHKLTGTQTTNDTGSVTGSQTEHTTGDSTVEATKSAFDSGSYEPYEKTETDTSDDTTVSNHTDNTMTSTGNTSEDISRNGTSNSTHTGRMFGNIGVMSSQDMLNQELEVAYFNLYDRIADIFISEYCIPIYI